MQVALIMDASGISAPLNFHQRNPKKNLEFHDSMITLQKDAFDCGIALQ